MIKNKVKYVFVTSVFVLIISVIMAWWGFPTIISREIKKNVQLVEGTRMYERWRKLPMPVTFNVYVFNVTNPAAAAAGARPRLQQLGPYVYRQNRERIVEDAADEGLVRYRLRRTFEFDESASGDCSEDDQLTVIHLPYMAALIAVQDLMPSLTATINKGLEELFGGPEDPFLRVRAKDLFFDGVYLNCESNSSAALDLICGRLRFDGGSTMRPSDNQTGFLFSMFAEMNSTESGVFEMVRGLGEDWPQLGRIASFEGRSNMSAVWRDPYCGMINGSDGTIFPPFGAHLPETLYSFEPEICRSLYVTRVGETTLFNMTAQYYEMPESALAAKTANPNNKCFCRKNWSASHDGCLLMGILNLSPCKKAPVLATMPHFYMASEELLEYFAGGVQPDKQKHNTYIYIEPTLGVVLSGARRLQFSIELRNIRDVPQVSSVLPGVFPLLWIEETATLPDDLVAELQWALRTLQYCAVAMWLLLAAGVSFCAAAAVAAARAHCPLLAKHNSVSFVTNSHKLDTVTQKGS